MSGSGKQSDGSPDTGRSHRQEALRQSDEEHYERPRSPSGIAQQWRHAGTLYCMYSSQRVKWGITEHLLSVDSHEARNESNDFILHHEILLTV